MGSGQIVALVNGVLLGDIMVPLLNGRMVSVVSGWSRRDATVL